MSTYDDAYAEGRALYLEAIEDQRKLMERNARLVAALEEMLVDPPATLDEPDTDSMVIMKMREIAREALANQQSTEKP